MSSPQIEYHCPDHGLRLSTFATATVNCGAHAKEGLGRCGKLCQPVSETDKAVRARALDALRKAGAR